MVDQFNEEHENSYVNMTTVFGQYEKVLTEIAGGNPPDIVSAVWLHQLVQIASQGVFYDGNASPIQPLEERDLLRTRR